ncbi:hypothetical protein GDO86_001058 [Hymenochirus boettgeri]|uniref:Uncharacterized protein n=1 Tax=Hymenochirus boettgeri TaxID=247094 RepID=A0A8T2KJK1_9PIPI|nr:hypothetical protein GDO86_001058 [Hymenochirus boettgeri]
MGLHRKRMCSGITAGLHVFIKILQQPFQEMSDSLLNNSWPSFSKLWLKRWSFKREEAVISQQDSFLEVQKEREKQSRQQSSRGNLLLEQEKQRNFEKQREELASLQKLQEQLKLEKQKWERDRDRQQKEVEDTENMLRQRIEAIQLDRQRLGNEREELEANRKAYQHDLERLREAQRAVEKDRERLEQLKRIKKSSSGAGTFPPDVIQAVAHSTSFNGEGMLNMDNPSQLPMKPNSKISVSLSTADYFEGRPEVVRRESSVSDIRPALKNEVPIHLLSATNQIQKQAALTKQQIPTKLAAMTKGKDKPSKGKASQRTESVASVDSRYLFPSKLSGKEDGSLRSRRSVSPSQLSSHSVFFQHDLPRQTEKAPEVPYTPSLYRPSSSQLLASPLLPPPPSPPSAENEGNKEDVIFF